MTEYFVRLKAIKYTLLQEIMGKLIITNMSYYANYHAQKIKYYT